MRRLYGCLGLLSFLMVFAAQTHAQKFDTLWTQVFWNGYFDSTNCVHATSDGGFVFTGVTRLEGQIDTDMHLVKTDSLGVEEWSRVQGDTVNECGFHVLQASDGGYLVSGLRYKPNNGTGKVWICKFNAEGDSTWAYIHAAADPDINGFPLHAIQTADNGYAITGIININYDNKAFILRLNESGGFVDFDTVSDYSHQDGVFITQMPDDGFMVAGNFNDPYSTQYDFWAFRTNSSGELLWDSIYAITDYTDIMYGACRDEDGVVMVGVARGKSWAHKIDFNGNTIWSKSISKYFTGEKVTTICPDPDSGYMVGGWIWVTGHRRDFCFTRLDPDGDTLWTYTVGGTQDDHGQWLVPTSDKGYAMVGSSTSFVNGECHYLVKTRSYFCGDANDDGIVNVGDIVYLVNYIFRDGPKPVLGYCHGDVNDDYLSNVGDVVNLVNYVFRDGDPPIETCCQ